MMALARDRLGEEHWVQGRVWAGHVPPTTSDIYALRAMENLGKALTVTESIIDEIEALRPGACALPDSKVVTLGRTAGFVRRITGVTPEIATGCDQGWLRKWQFSTGKNGGRGKD